MYFDKRLKQWAWYWHVKLKHKRKQLCSSFMSLDSFEMFKNTAHFDLFMNTDQPVFEIPRYNLKIRLLDDRYSVLFDGGCYEIPIEKQPCNYGGFRYFFRCPNQKCNKRVRLLYCYEGLFQCRKCLNLAYYTQRLYPTERWLQMAWKIEAQIKNSAGSLDRKPPWMKNKTFERLKSRYYYYHTTKFEEAFEMEDW